MPEERIITVRVDGHGRIVAENVPEGVVVVADPESEWTCGHKASAACAQCHRELILRANVLAEENIEQRERISELVEQARKLLALAIQLTELAEKMAAAK